MSNSATFEVLDEPPAAGWIVRIDVTMDVPPQRAIPLAARVADVTVVGLLEKDDLSGFTGYLTSVPADGAHLFVGYPGHEKDTDIVFHAPNA